MARSRERLCLEHGLRLDLVQLVRRGFIQPGANLGPRRIQWKDGVSGELIASGTITADMRGSDSGWLQINLEHFQQCFQLIACRAISAADSGILFCSELD